MRSVREFVSFFVFGALFASLLFASTPFVKWKCDIGPMFSSPAIGKDGTIYIGNLEGFICAVNLNGNLKWKYQTQGPIFSSPAIGKDGTIYIGSNDGYLYAMNPNGTLKWRYRVGFGAIGDFVKSSPAIGRDGTVYVGDTLGFLYAINPNGSLKWRVNTNAPIDFSSPAIGKNGTIYIGNEGGYLFAISSSGTLKWKINTGAPISFSSPAIDENGIIYIGNGRYDHGSLCAIEPSGKLKWKYSVDGPVTSSVAIGEGLFDISDENELYAENVYFNTPNYLYALNSNGILEWKYKDIPCYYYPNSSPLVEGESRWNRILVVGMDDILFGITSWEEVKWWFSTPAAINSSPAVGKDGTVYIGDMDGYLYAVKTNEELAKSAWPKFRHDKFNSGSMLTGK